MNVIRHLADISRHDRAWAATIGQFDGVHRGHQAVLSRLRERAAECSGESIVVLWQTRNALKLTSLRQRIALLAASGIERILLQRSTAVDVDVERAMLEALVGRLRVRSLVVGSRSESERLGVDARAQLLGPATNRFSVDVVPPVEVDGQLVSSRAIRRAVAAGNFSIAAALLGRPYSVAGRIVHGHHRGRPLGIPTANLRLRDIQLPPDGVYAVRAQLGDRSLPGVANIGYKPTFGDRERSVETHVLDLRVDADLYGQRLEVSFVECLRGERKFPDVPALVGQIRADIAAVRRLFERE